MLGDKLVNIKVADIIPNENQPRKTFDPYELSLLCESIKENGVLEPLIVRINGGKYLLIAGERRLKAAKMAGLKKVPCVVKKADDLTADCFAIIENLLRQDLSVFEEAEGINRLITIYGLSCAEIAEKIGIAQSTIESKLRLLKLDNVLRERITAARLTERHAKALLRIPEEKRKETLDIIIAKQLTVPETEEYIDKLLSPKSEQKKPVRKCAIGDVRLFANSLNKMVDTMRSGGITATTTKNETDTHIEYIVLITK
ncbi:MAG: ParB/RepB/Spo0J family partition protein [Clostridia bacterium]|nr:ParB/RepB/Spo0J family partition protein [Clostridia bacterium]